MTGQELRERIERVRGYLANIERDLEADGDVWRQDAEAMREQAAALYAGLREYMGEDRP